MRPRFSASVKTKQARAGGVGIDLGLAEAEAVLVAQAIVGVARLRRVARLDHQAGDVDGRPPLLPRHQNLADMGEGEGLLIAVGRAAIGHVGRAHDVVLQLLALAPFIGADAGQGLRIADPRRGIGAGAQGDGFPGAGAARKSPRVAAASASRRMSGIGRLSAACLVAMEASKRRACSARSSRWKARSGGKAGAAGAAAGVRWGWPCAGAASGRRCGGGGAWARSMSSGSAVCARATPTGASPSTAATTNGPRPPEDLGCAWFLPSFACRTPHGRAWDCPIRP